MLICREAAYVSPRAPKATRQRIGATRRSDRDSRGMVGRWTGKPVNTDIVDKYMCRSDAVTQNHCSCQRWSRLYCFQNAHSNQRTILAVLARLLVWAARHICRHCRHTRGVGPGLRLGRHRCHQGRKSQTGRHAHRKNKPEEPAKTHTPLSHEARNLGRRPFSQIRQRIAHSGRLFSCRSGGPRVNSWQQE